MAATSLSPSIVRPRRWRARLAFAAALGALLVVLVPGAGARAMSHVPAVHSHDSQGCSTSHPAQRDPSNPLDLASPPGANPLAGAQFFVPGPAKGSAAGAIATLMGLNPKTMPIDESWDRFAAQLSSGPLHARLTGHPDLARKVALLSKIADQPEAQRISSYSWGGSPEGIYKQTEKVLCQNIAADPGSVAILNTYFLHATLGGSPSPSQVRAYAPLFRARVDAMARAIGRQPVVLLLEIDGLGSTHGIVRTGALPAWEDLLRYEITATAALPHAVVYVEGGYSDSNSVVYTARALNAIGVQRIRGFFTNDTHEAWTANEVRWATAISHRTHGAHFIVDTADNGRGPLYNRNKVKDGVEDLCNPPGRGLGPRTTTDTGDTDADAWMWTHPPGNSSGCGGGPPGGVFWPARAESESARADSQLGPGLPRDPY